MTPPSPTAKERQDAANLTAVVVDSCSASESLLHDILHICAAFDLASVEALRDRAAVQFEGAKAASETDLPVGHYENRLNILNGVLTQLGRPQQSAAVVSINEHWKRRG